MSVLFHSSAPTYCPINGSEFEHSPITGMHIWFDKPVTDLPHATLLDRTLQWMFNKDGGRYLQLVVSASDHWSAWTVMMFLQLALRELSGVLSGGSNSGGAKLPCGQGSSSDVFRDSGLIAPICPH